MSFSTMNSIRKKAYNIIINTFSMSLDRSACFSIKARYCLYLFIMLRPLFVCMTFSMVLKYWFIHSCVLPTDTKIYSSKRLDRNKQ